MSERDPSELRAVSDQTLYALSVDLRQMAHDLERLTDQIVDELLELRQRPAPRRSLVPRRLRPQAKSKAR